MNSIKNKLHKVKPQLEIAEGLVVSVEYRTETIIDVAEYAEANLNNEKETFTKEDLEELNKHLSVIFKMLVTDKEEQKALLNEIKDLNLQDKMAVMNALITTAKFEDLEETAEVADKFQ